MTRYKYKVIDRALLLELLLLVRIAYRTTNNSTTNSNWHPDIKTGIVQTIQAEGVDNYRMEYQ